MNDTADGTLRLHTSPPLRVGSFQPCLPDVVVRNQLRCWRLGFCNAMTFPGHYHGYYYMAQDKLSR